MVGVLASLKSPKSFTSLDQVCKILTMYGVKSKILTRCHLELAWVDFTVTSKWLISDSLIGQGHPGSVHIVDVFSNLPLGRWVKVHQRIMRLLRFPKFRAIFDGLWRCYVGNTSSLSHRWRMDTLIGRLSSLEQLRQGLGRQGRLLREILSLDPAREDALKILLNFSVELIFGHRSHLHDILLANFSWCVLFVTASWHTSNLVE